MTPGGLSFLKHPPAQIAPHLRIIPEVYFDLGFGLPQPLSSLCLFLAPFRAWVGAGENSDRSIRKDARWSKRRPKLLELPRKLSD
nr:MAG TPA: hypothetical protein [Caudoviricetes sp.]